MNSPSLVTNKRVLMIIFSFFHPIIWKLDDAMNVNEGPN